MRAVLFVFHSDKYGCQSKLHLAQKGADIYHIFLNIKMRETCDYVVCCIALPRACPLPLTYLPRFVLADGVRRCGGLDNAAG